MFNTFVVVNIPIKNNHDSLRVPLLITFIVLSAKNWTFINHGAFGATLSPLLDEARNWQSQCESQPLRFYDRQLLPMIAHTVRETAKFLNCPADELIPLQNVTSGKFYPEYLLYTIFLIVGNILFILARRAADAFMNNFLNTPTNYTGLNSVLNSVPLQPGDEIVCLSLTYGSTKKIMQAACERTGAVLKTVNIPLPVLTPETVIAQFKEVISTRTKLVLLDQITSNTAMILPIADMAIMSKEVGAIVVIDAAHALFSQDCSIYGDDQRVHISSNYSTPNHIGSSSNSAIKISNASVAAESSSIPRPTHSESNNMSKNMVSISSFADVWITNAHKWMCSPKGCAFMWVSPHMAHALRPSIISHGYVPHAGNIRSDHSQVNGDNHCICL